MPGSFLFRHNHVVDFRNADGLFRDKDAAIISDLTREEFVAELASIGHPLTQRFFVRTSNLVRR